MRNVKLALLNIKKNFQNAKELKSAFITSIVGMCINNIAFIVLWYYFGKMVGNINGWEPFDIFGLYGFSKFVFKKLHEKEMDDEIEDYRAKYPDRRKERDEKTVQKNLGKAERLNKWGAFVAKLKKDKK